MFLKLDAAFIALILVILAYVGSYAFLMVTSYRARRKIGGGRDDTNDASDERA